MKIIDLQNLKAMLTSGSNNLYNRHYEVDKLNVFPVPDGDTGTNMNLTMMNGIKELNEREYSNLKEFATTFTRGLIMGARGNSGVILSQIFRGFFNLAATDKDYVESDKIDAKYILPALLQARDFAYKAVMKPVEGTILTVINDGATKVNQVLISDTNVITIFESLYQIMQVSLKNTQEILPILKKVGVVDSGGAGLLHIIDGMLTYLKTKKIVKINKKVVSHNNKFDFEITQEEFGYCTEVIIKLSKIKERTFNLPVVHNELEAMDGQSIVIVEDQDLIKLHIHTLTPGQILNYMQKYGDFLTVKVENMSEQAKAHAPTIVSPRQLKNDYAIIACINGKGVETYFKDELKVTSTILYSNRGNPATDDFLKAIASVDARVVYILPNDNNLILTAQKAKELETKSDVRIIKTVNVAQGLVSAITFYNLINSYNENEKDLAKLKAAKTKNRSSIYNKIERELNYIINKVSYGYISIASRAVDIDGIKVFKNNYIAAAQKIKNDKTKIVAAAKDLLIVIKKLFNDIIFSNAEIITIFKGKNATTEEVYQLAKVLDEEYDIEYDIIEGDQEIYNFLLAVE